MQTILTPMQMRLLEQAHFASTRSPSRELMARAARALTTAMDARGLVRGKHIRFVCGCGGNGGDGLAAAALCRTLGARCSVLLAMPRASFSGDAKHFLDQLPADIPVLEVRRVVDLDGIGTPDVWVDALFGIGLNRPVEGIPAVCIHRMHGAPVVSVDIPSGLDARTGEQLGRAVHADLTVTFEYPKPGHYLRHGPDCCGELAVMPIGISPRLLETLPPPAEGIPSILRIEDDDVRDWLPERRRFSHKGTYGHLLLIAGSRGMAGAACVAAKAALHSGAGLVTVACPEELVPILQIHAPEAMGLPLPQNEKGAIDPSACGILSEALRAKSAVAVGPGLSRSAAPEAVRLVLESGLPAVIDADALNLISAHPELKALLNENHLITPHPGEAARLVETSGDELSDAAALAKLGCAVLLKGAVSLIPGKHRLLLSDTGSVCMAKGGSGDMLTGIAGAMLAQGLVPSRAAAVASHAHGRAGERAERALGKRYPAAMDLIAMLADVWRELES